jgi:speckle-type POZ protein
MSKKICRFQLSIYGEKQKKVRTAVNVAHSPILQDFKRMFENEEHCDLKIHADDGVTLNAHKTILIARSPVFSKMLTSNMKEATTNTVKIEDFDSKTLRELLRFIYCGQVQDLEAVAGNLVHAAEKYDLDELKKICIEQLAENVLGENVVETLIIADQVSGTEKLVKACVPIVQT